MSKRVQLPEDNDDKELRILLEKFIRKSEELEQRESKVFKHVELVQSAVASLQAWKYDPPPPPPPPRAPSPPPPVDMHKIEEETQEIREETERIQREVEEKIEANKRLQAEIERRNTLLSERFVTFAATSKEIESRPPTAAPRQKLTYEPGVDFFRRKLDRLREMEEKVKAELRQESEEDRRKKKKLSEKIDKLERGANN